MKILLIEDDREAASYLMQALDEAGHVTHHASDGETGYAMASSCARSCAATAFRRPCCFSP